MKKRSMFKVTTMAAVSALVALAPMTVLAADGKVSVIDARNHAEQVYEWEEKKVAAHWEKDDYGTKYVLEDGTFLTNVWFQTANGNWYFLDEDGYQVTRWQNIDGVDYYFEQDGHMLIGWQKIDGQWYFFEFAPDSTRGVLYEEELAPDGRMADAEGILK